MTYYVKDKDKQYDAISTAVLYGPIKVLVGSILFLLATIIGVPFVIAAIFNISVVPLFVLILVNFVLARAYMVAVRSTARRFLLEKRPQ